MWPAGTRRRWPSKCCKRARRDLVGQGLQRLPAFHSVCYQRCLHCQHPCSRPAESGCLPHCCRSGACHYRGRRAAGEAERGGQLQRSETLKSWHVPAHLALFLIGALHVLCGSAGGAAVVVPASSQYRSVHGPVHRAGLHHHRVLQPRLGHRRHSPGQSRSRHPALDAAPGHGESGWTFVCVFRDGNLAGEPYS